MSPHDVEGFMFAAGLRDGLSPGPNERRWILGIDIPSLSSGMTRVSDTVLGIGKWGSLAKNGGHYSSPAASSDMILTTPGYHRCALDTSHIDAGLEADPAILSRRDHLDWSSLPYPWNITQRKSFFNDVQWSAERGSAHSGGFSTLPMHTMSPRLGLTMLTIFTDTSHRDGPTVLVPKSHLEVFRRLRKAGDPWLEEKQTIDLAEDIQLSSTHFFYFTGKAGDSIVMHPLLVHSRNGFRGKAKRKGSDELYQMGILSSSDTFRVLSQTAVFLRQSQDLSMLGVHGFKGGDGVSELVSAAE